MVKSDGKRQKAYLYIKIFHFSINRLSTTIRLKIQAPTSSYFKNRCFFSNLNILAEFWQFTVTESIKRPKQPLPNIIFDSITVSLFLQVNIYKCFMFNALIIKQTDIWTPPTNNSVILPVAKTIQSTYTHISIKTFHLSL